MKIESNLTDTAILVELGRRISQHRLDLKLTQAHVAEQAGVSKRTVERIEAGQSAQLTSLIRILRALDIMHGLDSLVIETAPRPMDVLRRKGKIRQRASSSTRQKKTSDSWSWGSGAGAASGGGNVDGSGSGRGVGNVSEDGNGS